MSGSDASVTVVLADRIRCVFPASVKSVVSWPRVDSLARWSRLHGGEGHDLRVRRGGRAGTFLWRRLQLRHGNTTVAERAPTASGGAERVRRTQPSLTLPALRERRRPLVARSASE